jgi:hypothetical protein
MPSGKPSRHGGRRHLPSVGGARFYVWKKGFAHVSVDEVRRVRLLETARASAYPPCASPLM